MSAAASAIGPENEGTRGEVLSRSDTILYWLSESGLGMGRKVRSNRETREFPTGEKHENLEPPNSLSATLEITLERVWCIRSTRKQCKMLSEDTLGERDVIPSDCRSRFDLSPPCLHAPPPLSTRLLQREEYGSRCSRADAFAPVLLVRQTRTIDFDLFNIVDQTKDHSTSSVFFLDRGDERARQRRHDYGWEEEGTKQGNQENARERRQPGHELDQLWKDDAHPGELQLSSYTTQAR